MLQPNHTQGHQPATIEAFGQTWYFSRDALIALKSYGIGSPTSLKAMVIDLTSMKGIDDGVHEVNYLSIELRLTVKGDSIIVDDPTNTR